MNVIINLVVYKETSVGAEKLRKREMDRKGTQSEAS
jgi:hypothetical protein